MNHAQEQADILSERERNEIFLNDAFIAAIRYGNGMAEPEWAPLYCKGSKYERKAKLTDILADAMDDVHEQGYSELVVLLSAAMASHDLALKNYATDFVKRRAAHWVSCNAE